MSPAANACTLACRSVASSRLSSSPVVAVLGTASYPQRHDRARCVLRAAWREAALEHNDAVRTEPQMRKAHRLHRGCDRARVHNANVLANASDRHVRAKRFVVEPDRAMAELGTNALAERQQVRRARSDPEPNDTRTTGRRKATGTIKLDVERGHAARCSLHGCSRVSEPLVGCLPEERQRDVHELRLHAAKRGKVRGAAECCLGDFGWKWERDEEPYARRLEPCGVRLVSDQQSDEHDPEKATEAGERGRADPLAARDAFPCVCDQSTHCDTRLSKQRAACSSAERVT